MSHVPFDGLIYIASYVDLIRAYGGNAEAGRRHWEEFGRAEGRNPHLFNPILYGASHPDLLQAYGTDTEALLHHYLRVGWSEGRAIDSFDRLHYAASNPDLIRAYGTDEAALVDHYLRVGWTENRPLTSFDAYHYAASNPDVLAYYGADVDGLIEHYVRTGFSEGRSTDSFDALRYGASYQDLALAFGTDQDALIAHYVVNGFREGRDPLLFDAIQYVAAHVDLVLAGFASNVNQATLHYLTFGASEERAISGFDTTAYLLSNPDLSARKFSLDQAFQHWLHHGAAEGRPGDALFGRDQDGHVFVNQVASEAIDVAGDRDWFKFSAEIDKPFSLHMSGLEGQDFDGVISIYDRHGALILTSEEPNWLDYFPTYSGDYYAVVTAQPTGDYQLTAASNLHLVMGPDSDLVIGPGPEHRVYVTLRGSRDINDASTDRGSFELDASNTTSALTFRVDSSEIQSNDLVTGSSNGTDVLELTYLIYSRPSGDAPSPDGFTRVSLEGMTGIEKVVINVVDAIGGRQATHGPIIVDTAIADLDGTDTLRIEVLGTAPHIFYDGSLWAPVDASQATANLIITGSGGVIGGSGNDVIVTANAEAIVDGGAGNDSLTGSSSADQLHGGEGDDIIIGGLNFTGGDILSGGTGADLFVYRSTAESRTASPDRILDFESGVDTIDLSLVDANLQAPGNQSFSYLGSGTFTGTSGELRTHYDAGAGAWRVDGDVDGDGAADFTILLMGAAAQPTAGDFIF